jgi:hypothetical protein
MSAKIELKFSWRGSREADRLQENCTATLQDNIRSNPVSRAAAVPEASGAAGSPDAVVDLCGPFFDRRGLFGIEAVYIAWNIPGFLAI